MPESLPPLPEPSTRPAPPAAAFQIRALVAGFGQTTVLRGIDLRVPSSRVTAIVGPSGSGKTTLLRCLNRMHEVSRRAWLQGRIALDGQELYEPKVDPAALRRRVGMVFQAPTPFPTMSVGDNVLAGLRLVGERPSRPRDVVKQALKQVGLWSETKGRLDEPATALSLGQQQRLCIARSLALEPDVLLMDEPTSALDPLATRRVEELVQGLRERYTVVIVTHNLQQAARVSDRTVFLLDGELVEDADTDTLFTRPADPRTEAYLTGRLRR